MKIKDDGRPVNVVSTQWEISLSERMTMPSPKGSCHWKRTNERRIQQEFKRVELEQRMLSEKEIVKT